MRLRPLGSWVLVEEQEPDNRFGSIWLPRNGDNELFPTRQALVTAIGPSVSTVSPGERVVVKWSHLHTYKDQARVVRAWTSRRQRLVREDTILGVMA